MAVFFLDDDINFGPLTTPLTDSNSCILPYRGLGFIGTVPQSP